MLNRAVASVLLAAMMAACLGVDQGDSASFESGERSVSAVQSTPVSEVAACTNPPTPAAEVRGRLAPLRVMNYYPSDRGWHYMWSGWDAGILDTDFARITALNANAVRLIVHPSVFGYPEPSVEMRGLLARTIDLAASHGLAVQLTLFDGWANYDDLDGSLQWATALLGPYRDDPSIAFVELQNEIELSDPAASAWARALVPCVKSLVGSVPVTISASGSGVSGLQQLIAAEVPVDFYDLHYYGPAPLAYATFSSALHVVGDRPLFIGETGYSTAPTSDRARLPYNQAWWESEQDHYLRTVENAARALRLPAPAPWTLTDFLAGLIPSNLGEQQYGLYRADGGPKASVATIRAAFGPGPIDLSFNNGFEHSTGSGLPTTWKLWEPTMGSFARDTTVAHTGIASVSIGQSTGSPTGVPAFYVAPVQPIVPGGTYEATVWAKGSSATGMTRLMLAWFDGDSRWLGNVSSADLPPGSPDWTQLKVVAQAPAAARFVEIHLVSAWNRGSAWFDDVSFN